MTFSRRMLLPALTAMLLASGMQRDAAAQTAGENINDAISESLNTDAVSQSAAGKMPSFCVKESKDTKTGMTGYIVSYPLVIDSIMRQLTRQRYSQGYIAQSDLTTDLAALRAVVPVLPADKKAADDHSAPDSREPQRPSYRRQSLVSAAVYDALSHFIAARVWPYDSPVNNDGPLPVQQRDRERFVVMDPNGVNVPLEFDMTRADVSNDKSIADHDVLSLTRAHELLQKIVKSEKYKIACKVIAPGQDKTLTKHPEKDEKRLPLESYMPPRTVVPHGISTANLRLSGARDGLMLSAYGAHDGIGGGATISLQPGTKSASNPDPPLSYNVIGALGYTLFHDQCDYRATGCAANSATLLVDTYEGADRNLPKTLVLPPNSDTTINRIGAGFDWARRSNPAIPWLYKYDQEQAIALVMQVIPEFITDGHFISKEAYGELRFDVIDIPGALCFGNNNWDIEKLVTINCGLAAIGDVAHTFIQRKTPFTTYNNFARLGEESGLSLTPNAASDLSISGWYRIVADLSGNHATAHEFTGQVAYKIKAADSTITLGLQYTDGVEDITLFPLPTWAFNIKAGL